MEAKQKAKELVDHYFDVVYPYVGSDYMTGTESPSYKFRSAQKEAAYFIDGILNLEIPPQKSNNLNVIEFCHSRRLDWLEVKRDLYLITEQEYFKDK